MIDFEPGVMWSHRGQLTAAHDIVRKLRSYYSDSKFGDILDDIFYLMLSADKELMKLTEEKNKKLYDEIVKPEIESGVIENEGI